MRGSKRIARRVFVRTVQRYMLTDRQQEALRLREQGLTPREIGEILGITKRNAQNLLQRGKQNLDPAIEAGMRAARTGLVPDLAWVKVPPTEDAPGYSLMLKPGQPSPEDLAERIKEAFADMPAAEPVPAPTYTDADLATIYPIADRHNGMRSWGKETGEDYDSKIADARLRDWMGRCVASSPSSGTAIILDLGDGEHVDDASNVTPKSKHPLDADGRIFMTLETSVSSLGAAIEMALAKHARVIVRILPGNHNPTLYMAVMFALAERYRDNPRVEVQKVPGEFFAFDFGQCFIAAHHGDKSKPERMVMFLADEYAAQWGRTRHRFLFTGHLHHHKSADIGGVTWEQLRALTARDAYAVSHAFTARAQLQAITLHKDRGEIQRVKVGL